MMIVWAIRSDGSTLYGFAPEGEPATVIDPVDPIWLRAVRVGRLKRLRANMRIWCRKT